MKLVLANFSRISYDTDDGLNFVCSRESIEQCDTDKIKLTPENLRYVTIVTDEGGIIAEFTDLILVGTEENPVYGNDHETIEGYTLIIHLRQKTEIQLLTERMEALEESQEVQDGAIDDLGEAVSTLFEEE